jgi:gamma-glutamylcyclotransferase (GGCT)/AIG2-like uncharacterized protein YtfP
MVLNGLQSEARRALLDSRELRSFVGLQPQIMDHDTLRRRRYRPDVPIPPELVRKASEKHRKLVRAYRELENGANRDAEVPVLKWTADLLYIVRSNIAHGEKTPHGPDVIKRDRDAQVCLVVTPLQVLLFDLLLDWPSRKLVAYGTLAPGQVNHELLADIPGEWQDCEVRGSISLRSGLPALSWTPSGPEVRTQLLTSSELPKRWPLIDTFEGKGYKRRLLPTRTPTGIAIAYVYLAAED